MESMFWTMFGIATALKALLIPAYHSTDFEVHRNWLAITHSLPLKSWYVDATSEWTLDYPPFFAYFEWLLAKLAFYVDPQMLVLDNLNYASLHTKYFQRGSVIVTDIVYALGIWRCLRVLRIPKQPMHQFTAEVLFLLNIGLLFVDHIHFQYNGLLFGILLLSMSCMLEGRYLWAAFTFAVLLNFKHIFLYIAPAFGVYLLKFYCFETDKKPLARIAKLAAVGLLPFVLSFGPFWRQLPQVFQRLFPFKRGLTHAYWAPNFWAIYNIADKVALFALRVPRNESAASTSSGLVQDFKHIVLPTITPKITFALTFLFMLPCLIKLCFYTSKSESKHVFLRCVVLCAAASFMFGWHVHEKAILMCLIPLTLLYLHNSTEAKHAFMLSIVGYFSLFPLLFHPDLIVVRYSMYLAYICFMYAQIIRMYKAPPALHLMEQLYIFGFMAIPVYEHILTPVFGLNEKYPFMPLLLTSLYCSLGVLYFFIRYYVYTLDINVNAKLNVKTKNQVKSKVKVTNVKRVSRAKQKTK